MRFIIGTTGIYSDDRAKLNKKNDSAPLTVKKTASESVDSDAVGIIKKICLMALACSCVCERRQTLRPSSLRGAL